MAFVPDRKSRTENRHGERARRADNLLVKPNQFRKEGLLLLDAVELVCETCNGRLMRIIEEPVARKVHSRTAHRKRVIAKCPVCNTTMTIKYGGLVVPKHNAT
jgi:uncharacterized protein with PIN domain